MRWRCLFVALLPLLASCAATVPSPSTTADGSDYFRGISSDYSIRVDNLRNRAVVGADLQDGLVAGDEEVAVATAMFRHGDYLTLDLVILNHTEDPLVLERDDITVYDDLGRKLEPVSDYRGAAQLGLRGKLQQRRGFSDLEAVDLAGDFGGSPVSVESGMATTKHRSSSGGASRAPRGGTEVTRISRASDQDTKIAALPLVHVEGKTSRAYWAYWKAKEIALPLTAVVKVEGHNLLYRFGD